MDGRWSRKKNCKGRLRGRKERGRGEEGQGTCWMDFVAI